MSNPFPTAMDSLTANLEDLNLASPSYLQLQSPLFSLPAELRNTIYELVLTLSPPMILVDLTLYSIPSDSSPPALLFTCKRVNSETQKLFYTLNTLYIIAPTFTVDGELDYIAFRRLATTHPGSKNVATVKVFLGRMLPLQQLKWMGFLGPWIRVLECLLVVRSKVGRVRISFEIGDRDGRVEFGIGSEEEVKEGFDRAIEWEEEDDKARKIERTIVKTLFPSDS